MNFYLLLSFSLYCLVTSVTPGPNNILLVSSGVHFGFKKTIPHILGIGVGFFAMFVFLAIFISQLFKVSYLFYEILKIAGVIYLLYLAYKILQSNYSNKKTYQRLSPFTFIQAALFQWINPKAWVMAIGAISTYTSPASNINAIVFLGFIYCIINIPSTAIWAYTGSHLQQFINNAAKFKTFNFIMAILLIISVISPIINIFNYWIPQQQHSR